MIIRDPNPPPLPIRVVRSHTCDGCGTADLDPDEVLCPTCKARLRGASAPREGGPGGR